MSGNGDQVIAKLIEMGFENSAVVEAVEAVGPLFDEAIEYVLNGSNRNCNGVSNTSSSSHCFKNNGNGKTQGKRGLGQSSILDHFQSRQKRSQSDVVSDGLVSRAGSVVLPGVVG
ncbi:ATP-dependent DNA helicase Q-like SIM [Pistacia vera]|uniref:ATP-dependent DNA helicase Q-like SIM n=1 Tax=Pistacia vera TaxID=55513 RepID=UPI001262E67D|nr:ATP-dependent DNA helicase Q-like SIM [Pistacia vera]